MLFSICSPTTQSKVKPFAYKLEIYLVIINNTKIFALIAFHHSKESVTLVFAQTCRIVEMSHFPAHFYIGLALLALLFVNQITANKPRVNRASKIAPTTGPPANCYTLFFNAGPTKRIETLLMKVNKTLSQVESDIKTLKGTCCNTSVKGNENSKTIEQHVQGMGLLHSPSQLIPRAILRHRSYSQVTLDFAHFNFASEKQKRNKKLGKVHEEGKLRGECGLWLRLSEKRRTKTLSLPLANNLPDPQRRSLVSKKK